jgi:hypothetical protein
MTDRKKKRCEEVDARMREIEQSVLVRKIHVNERVNILYG